MSPRRDFSINDGGPPSVSIQLSRGWLALSCRPTWQEATNFVVDLHWLTGNLSSGAEMGKPEKLTLVCDADGSIGVVLEFSDSDFEAYSMPDLALVGAFQTKAQAAQALGARTHQFRH